MRIIRSCIVGVLIFTAMLIAYSVGKGANEPKVEPGSLSPLEILGGEEYQKARRPSPPDSIGKATISRKKTPYFSADLLGIVECGIELRIESKKVPFTHGSSEKSTTAYPGSRLGLTYEITNISETLLDNIFLGVWTSEAIQEDRSRDDNCFKLRCANCKVIPLPTGCSAKVATEGFKISERAKPGDVETITFKISRDGLYFCTIGLNGHFVLVFAHF